MTDDVDINPCDACSPQAYCIWNQCVCTYGYTGDGHNCTGKSH